MRFDEHSFKEEITNKEEARACYMYFMQNMQEFRRELYEVGKSGDESFDLIRQLWQNLIESSKRVGFTNLHLANVEEYFQRDK